MSGRKKTGSGRSEGQRQVHHVGARGAGNGTAGPFASSQLPLSAAASAASAPAPQLSAAGKGGRRRRSARRCRSVPRHQKGDVVASRDLVGQASAQAPGCARRARVPRAGSPWALSAVDVKPGGPVAQRRTKGARAASALRRIRSPSASVATISPLGARRRPALGRARVGVRGDDPRVMREGAPRGPVRSRSRSPRSRRPARSEYGEHRDRAPPPKPRTATRPPLIREICRRPRSSRRYRRRRPARRPGLRPPGALSVQPSSGASASARGPARDQQSR